MKLKEVFLFFMISIVFITACDKDEVVKVVSVTFNSASITLMEGESEKLIATVSPNDAENKSIIWYTSDSSVASIINGNITAIKEGSTVITAKTDDGGKTASCTVTVKSKVINVESITLDKNTLDLTTGESQVIKATINPSNATNKNITWTSSNTSVAVVLDGNITAIKEGSTVITAKTDDGGRTVSCVVTVKDDPIIANLEIITGDISELTPLTVSISASFRGFEGIIGKAWKFGICYGGSQNPSITDKTVFIIETKDGSYNIPIKINPDETVFYRAIAYFDGNYYYGEIKSFKSPHLPLDIQAVDLGLSVKWANCNLGANATHEDGSYYAWGETEVKSVYTHSTYKYYDSNAGVYINIGNDISGTEYDAARVMLGNGWRMPTYKEISELYEKCTWQRVTYKGKEGYLVTGKNGNSIFIVTVSCTNTASSKMRYSHFWSSTLDTNDSSGRIYYLNYSYFKDVSNTYMAKTTFREYGLPIRPVFE